MWAKSIDLKLKGRVSDHKIEKLKNGIILNDGITTSCDCKKN